MKKVLPKDTNITKYLRYKNHIFSVMALPDGRYLVCIVYTWGDGQIIEVNGFEYSDGIFRSGLNPLHIVRIYETEVSKETLMRDLKKFLNRSYLEQHKSKRSC